MLPSLRHNIILFELDFNVKFPLLRLLQFLSDLKSTILGLKGIRRPGAELIQLLALFHLQTQDLNTR